MLLNRLAPLTLLTLLAWVLGGCKDPVNDNGKAGPQQAASSKVTIAVAGPMSGPASAFGAMIKMGAELAAEQLNAAGGIKGRKLELNIQDDKGDATEAANVARKLAGDPSVPVIVGHFNSVCTNKAKIEYNEVGVVSISPGSTNVLVCKGFPYTFRNLYRDDFQGQLLARFIQQKLGGKKVAVFYDNDDYGKGLMQYFTAECQAIGLAHLEPIAYQRERIQDFKSLVSQIVDQQPDTIFVSGLYNEGGLICKAARQDLNMQVHFLGGDGLVSPDFISTAKDAAEGAYLSTPFHFDPAQASPLARNFYEAFVAKFKKEPDTWAALTFDAVMMSAKAIEAVGTDRKQIREWFASITSKEKAFEGVTGKTYFDAEGDCQKPLAFISVKNGKMVLADKQMD